MKESVINKGKKSFLGSRHALWGNLRFLLVLGGHKDGGWGGFRGGDKMPYLELIFGI